MLWVCLAQKFNDALVLCWIDTLLTLHINVCAHICHESYNSFFSLFLSFSAPAANAIGSFSTVGGALCVINTYTAVTASPTSAIILAHAIPQTLMLTLPTGARGKLSIHSA
jgi:hypothetical protein